MKKYFDDFAEWVPEPKPAARFEPAAPRLRRLEALTVTWRGQVHRFEPEDRLLFGQRTPVLSLITLWPPTSADPAHPWPRQCWTADALIRGFGFLEGKGDTPQRALDALSAALPANATTMVRGGSC